MLSRGQFAVFALALAACTSPSQRGRPAGTEQPSIALDPREEQLFKAVNAVRQQHRLPELQWNPAVAALARSHSDAMARNGFFSHIDPRTGPLDARMKTARVQWSSIAENLFRQRGCPDAVHCAVQGWTKSAQHRRNMLNPSYTHTGIGITSDDDGTLYYTQIFLAPVGDA
jgi:uncharacterized protein YkwD